MKTDRLTLRSCASIGSRALLPTGLTVLLVACSGCGSSETVEPERIDPAAEPPVRVVELLPGIRVNPAERWIEFDGEVPIDCHNPTTPAVYLELVACSPDTREHESLVVTPVRPSHVHAGLVALGLEPGAPARFEPRERGIERIGAHGDAVRIELHWEDEDGPRVATPGDWIVDAETGEGFGGPDTPGGWVFAGSREVDRVMPLLDGTEIRIRYDADGAGTLIGLATFGGEVIAPRQTIHPDSLVDEPVWIADSSIVPDRGTPVTVRLIAVMTGRASNQRSIENSISRGSPDAPSMTRTSTERPSRRPDS